MSFTYDAWHPFFKSWYENLASSEVQEVVLSTEPCFLICCSGAFSDLSLGKEQSWSQLRTLCTQPWIWKGALFCPENTGRGPWALCVLKWLGNKTISAVVSLAFSKICKHFSPFFQNQISSMQSSTWSTSKYVMSDTSRNRRGSHWKALVSLPESCHVDTALRCWANSQRYAFLPC